MPVSIPLQALQPKVSYTSLSSTEDADWSVETLYKTAGDDKGDWDSDPLDSKGMESRASSSFWHEDNRSPFRQRWTHLQSRLPTGWRLGAWIATVQATIVLLINIAVAMWTAVKFGGSSSGIIFQGDCNTVDRLTIGIHLVINVLSTLLLGASNYVMQSLCAPTRAEVNQAHKNGSWLDIGLQSVRNLKYTSHWKRRIWICLCVSSIPLHLLYNSSFFSVLGANEYQTIVASGPDIQQVPANGSYDWKLSGSNIYYSNDSAISEWEFLDASACLRAYATDFVTDRGDVILVTNYTANDTVVPLGDTGYLDDGVVSSPSGPFAWICANVVSVGQKTCSDVWSSINASDWTINLLTFDDDSSYTLPVRYCISQPMEAKCQLESNIPLLAVVIIFNAVKVLCMVIVVTRMKDYPLVTVGDAIASFIQDPDLDTSDMCLVSASHFQDQPKGQSYYAIPQPIEYQPHRIRWMSAASPKHWAITILLFISAISIVLGLLGFAIDQLAENFGETGYSALWKLGLGKTHSQNIIEGWVIPSQGYGALLATVLISNSPQLILSMIYVFFNSLCTKLFLALEWSTYSRSRKPLRVSYPKGDQRSTYFLHIPVRFGFPLLVYSAVLHWLVSQSIFLVKVSYWASNTQELSTDASITSCGFSPLGMILTSIVGGFLLLIALAMGYFRYLNGDMPLAGSCSAAIAAACHAPKDDSELRAVKWGVVSGEDDSGKDVGHISFSSGVVTKPVIGHRYA